ncbi:DUF2459 domain-containing protein [Oculatella sp. LEGE 06141]|nr:DUF2459 domain-containing protein [Oculatella sp. LEGE 06141]
MLSWIGFVLIRTPTVIFPPAAPVSLVTVYVTDYGYHSRLTLPEPDGSLIQYTYGDWRYFALKQQNLTSGLAALLLPTPATLGRRQYENFESLRQSLGSNWQAVLHSVPVAATSVTRLVDRLDRRYQRNLQTEVVHPDSGLSFVQDDQVYTLVHNSNHELVEWLEALGCRVEGFVTWPNFEVESAN